MDKKISQKIIWAEITILLILCSIWVWKSGAVFASKIVSDFVFEELSAPKREIHAIEEEQKICYLTFDDGPSYNTEKILDILIQYDAKATFFVVGSNLTEENRPILERIVKEGHAIGMHANEHVYTKLYASIGSFLQDYECLYTTLRDDFGIETAIFRFPGGSCCTYLYGQGKTYIKKMQDRGFYCFDWNVTGEDSVGTPTVYSIQKNVFSRVFQYKRPIVLLHDSNIAERTVEALSGMIERIQEEGYAFSSLENVQEYIFPNNR